MDRHTLLQQLDVYQPTDPHEIVAKARMINFINDHHDCFERSLAIGHITASAWLLNQDGSKALLMHHAKLDKWVQLGGHCDGNPDVLAVAIKEAQEESGIEHIVPVSPRIFDIDIHLVPANPREKEHYHYDVRFLLQVASNEQFIQNSESKELRWIGRDLQDAPEINSSVMRMVNKWLEI